ncbi:uncharacterized protein Dana_GF10194, isoform C [Drosophila ananassae]|uniref:Uncharacterized protein, isoform C n=1 Tax=Drosophila ananassae TaxID=7217 RepID=A0A0P8ZUH3_DROAN|nr:uncharacterized protein LOC6493068 isoform X2 [Drosophila ananassae]KPU78216.1 uncharacterized protein Dana_GF10194, isoform C [Drosophila ananassae]
MVKRKSAESKEVFLSESEQADKQKKYFNRIQDVVTTCTIFKNAVENFKELEVERAIKERWEQYLRCDEIPNPSEPVEVRTFLAKIRHFEEIEANTSRDWTLQVDERSILTQNIYAKNLTREVLRKALSDNPGLYYGVNISNCLETLDQIDIFVNNEEEILALAPQTRQEIFEVYKEVQQEIVSLFDRLAYRILRMQRVYMSSTNGIVGHWGYSCDSWQMDIWGLFNVPILFEQLPVPVMLAEFPCSGVEVQVPISVLDDCLTIRCVHTSFDHYSQNAHSAPDYVVDNDYMPSAGIKDMEESLISEWLLQQDIQSEVLDAMNQRYQDYQDTLNLIAERTEQAAKADKSDADGRKSKIIIPKIPKLVNPVPPGMLPDIYQEFIHREEKQYKSFLDVAYDPKHISLMPKDLNMRAHIIAGGIYSLMVVRRPEQTAYQNLSVLLHEDQRKIKNLADVVCRTDFKGQSMSLRVSEFVRADQRNSLFKLNESDLPYFHVTMKLPPDLCRWGTPKVCQFLSSTHKNITRRKRSTAHLSFFDFKRVSSRCSYITNNSNSRMSLLANAFAPPLMSILRFSKMAMPVDRVFRRKDFHLDKRLSKMEVMNLKNACIPRIISSFKMPRDYLDVPKDAESQAKSHALVKRFDVADTVEEAPKMDNFEFEVQDDPERMFPHFETQYNELFDESEVDQLDGTKKTANGLVATFDSIMLQYMSRPNAILRQIDVNAKKSVKKGAVEEQPILDDLFKRKSLKKSVTSETTKLARKSDAGKKVISLNVPSRLSMRTSEMSFKAPSRDNLQTKKPRGSKKKSRDTSNLSLPQGYDDDEDEYEFSTETVQQWSTKHIKDMKRYEHFPFRDWVLQPNEENPNEVLLKLDTFHVRTFFYISAQGVRGYVTDLSKGYTAKPVKYLEIKEPISDFRVFRKLLIDKNLNIFAANDASYYIDNGYFSIKHVACEEHTYNVMALYCKIMKFYRSSWNRLALRRDILINMKFVKDTSDLSDVTVRICPEGATFVKVTEKCSDDVDVVKLTYEETWRNISTYADLNHAILSMNPHSEDLNKEIKLFVNIKRFLSEIRILSYS